MVVSKARRCLFDLLSPETAVVGRFPALNLQDSAGTHYVYELYERTEFSAAALAARCVLEGHCSAQTIKVRDILPTSV